MDKDTSLTGHFNNYLALRAEKAEKLRSKNSPFIAFMYGAILATLIFIANHNTSHQPPHPQEQQP